MPRRPDSLMVGGLQMMESKTTTPCVLGLHSYAGSQLVRGEVRVINHSLGFKECSEVCSRIPFGYMGKWPRVHLT